MHVRLDSKDFLSGVCCSAQEVNKECVRCHFKSVFTHLCNCNHYLCKFSCSLVNHAVYKQFAHAMRHSTCFQNSSSRYEPFVFFPDLKLNRHHFRQISKKKVIVSQHPTTVTTQKPESRRFNLEKRRVWLSCWSWSAGVLFSNLRASQPSWPTITRLLRSMFRERLERDGCWGLSVGCSWQPAARRTAGRGNASAMNVVCSSHFQQSVVQWWQPPPPRRQSEWQRQWHQVFALLHFCSLSGRAGGRNEWAEGVRQFKECSKHVQRLVFFLVVVVLFSGFRCYLHRTGTPNYVYSALSGQIIRSCGEAGVKYSRCLNRMRHLNRDKCSPR